MAIHRSLRKILQCTYLAASRICCTRLCTKQGSLLAILAETTLSECFVARIREIVQISTTMLSSVELSFLSKTCESQRHSHAPSILAFLGSNGRSLNLILGPIPDPQLHFHANCLFGSACDPPLPNLADSSQTRASCAWAITKARAPVRLCHLVHLCNDTRGTQA